MASPEITVGTGSNHPAEPPAQSGGPQVAMRPYFDDTDKKYVQYLFFSSYLNLVTIGVKIRLQSPVILISWFIISVIAYIELPKALEVLDLGPLIMIGIKGFLVVACFAFGIAGLLWYVDKMVVSQRIERGFANDMGNIEKYYLGWIKEEQTVDGETQVQKVRADESNFSNFWVLTVNGDIVGCAGLHHNQLDITDKYSGQRPKHLESLKSDPAVQNASWARLSYALAVVDDFVRLCIVKFHNTLMDVYERVVPAKKSEVLFKAHKANEATLQRLAIKTEYQDHGLSTVLIKRVILWAHSHKIEHLFATTDELQVKMGDILSKRHGFQQVSTKKTGLYSHETLWKLDVKDWAEKFTKERAEEQNVVKQ
jgi:N-acetylglutamate synthase-like GNAT family acetyltransferase